MVIVSDPFDGDLPDNWHWGLSRELDSGYTYFIYHDDWEGKLMWDGMRCTVEFRRKLGEEEYSEVKYSESFESSEESFKYAKQKAVELDSRGR